FLTAVLWGVGNTGPWLHDNRAGSLREAVLLHGEDTPVAVGAPGRSEAQEARDAFKALAPADQDALVAFLSSLRTFAPPRKDGSRQGPAAGFICPGVSAVCSRWSSPRRRAAHRWRGRRHRHRPRRAFPSRFTSTRRSCSDPCGRSGDSSAPTSQT